MKIDRNLNLVVPVEIEPEELDASGEVRRPAQHYYVHASPISLETFEENVFLLAKGFGKTLEAGYNLGPRTAAMILRRVAIDIYGEGERVSGTLMAEIRRLCMVAVPSDRGYVTIPLEEAFNSGQMTKGDVSHVEGAIVFFSEAWQILRGAERDAMIRGAVQLWGGSTTSLNSTDYARSLTTLTPPASIGEKALLPTGTVLDNGRPSSLPS